MLERVIVVIKKLPIEENPPIKTVNGYGFPLGIIGGHHEDYMPWVISNFLNISYHPLRFIKRLDRLCFRKSAYFFWSFFHFKINFLLRRGEIVEHLKQEIDKGNYIALYLNEYFIPGKSSYQKRNFIHDKYIYGYNDDLKVFYALSIADKGMFKPHEISDENIKGAFSYYFFNHFFFSFRLKEYDFSKIDSKKIKKQLRRYLCGRKNYGINCYDLIIKHFNALGSNEPVNMLTLRMFKEHKGILSQLDESFITVKKQFDALFYWCIKYNLTFDKAILEHQAEKLQKLKQEEYSLIETYLKQM